MAGMDPRPPLHESARRLYAAAQEAEGDDAPAKVARRMNVSAQTLQNWEDRGISKDGALRAQATYGCDANWLLGTSGGQAWRASPVISQPLRLNPVMLSETHRALRKLEHAEGRAFSLEKEADAERFVQLYEMRAAMPAHPSQDEWVEFGRKLAAITTPTGGDDGRSDGVPAHGTGTKKVARGLRRKG